MPMPDAARAAGSLGSVPAFVCAPAGVAIKAAAIADHEDTSDDDVLMAPDLSKDCAKEKLVEEAPAAISAPCAPPLPMMGCFPTPPSALAPPSEMNSIGGVALPLTAAAAAAAAAAATSAPGYARRRARTAFGSVRCSGCNCFGVKGPCCDGAKYYVVLRSKSLVKEVRESLSKMAFDSFDQANSVRHWMHGCALHTQRQQQQRRRQEQLEKQQREIEHFHLQHLQLAAPVRPLPFLVGGGAPPQPLRAAPPAPALAPAPGSFTAVAAEPPRKRKKNGDEELVQQGLAGAAHAATGNWAAAMFPSAAVVAPTPPQWTDQLLLGLRPRPYAAPVGGFASAPPAATVPTMLQMWQQHQAGAASALSAPHSRAPPAVPLLSAQQLAWQQQCWETHQRQLAALHLGTYQP